MKSFKKKYPTQPLEIYEYPFIISRCGAEHAATEENSLHSLPYFYNFCLSFCHYAYVIKWDADMVLSKNSKHAFKQYVNKLNSYWPTFWLVEIQTLYKKNNLFLLSNNEINKEIRIFPNRSDVNFIKDKNYELLNGKIYNSNIITKDKVKIYELKDIDENEFSHWSTTDFPTERKKERIY